MAAAQGRLTGFKQKVYFVDTPLARDADAAAIEAVLVADNLIKDVNEIGDLTLTSPQIAINLYNSTQGISVSGQTEAPNMSFGVVLDLSNDGHVKIRDDDTQTERNIIVVYETSATQRTYFVYQGRIGSKTFTTPVDNIVGMNFEFNHTENVRYVNNATV